MRSRMRILRLWLLLSLLMFSVTRSVLCQAESLVPDALASERADQLTALAKRYFPNLSSADLRLLRTATTGETASIGAESVEAVNIKKDQQNRIDAQLLRWLATDPDAGKLVDPSGISVRGAWVDGTLNLEDETITLPIELVQCRIDDGIDLISARARVINLKNSLVSWIQASGLSVERDLFMKDGSYGQVILDNARISGDIHLDRAKLGDLVNLEADRDYALMDLRNAQVGGGVYLNGAMAAARTDTPGVFDATGATIHGEVHFDQFREKEFDGNSQIKNGLGNYSSVKISDTRIDGLLSLVGMTFPGNINDGINLTAAKAQFINLDDSVIPWIWASGVSVDRDLSMSNGTYGQAILNDARVGGNLYVSNSRFGAAAIPIKNVRRFLLMNSDNAALMNIRNAQIGGSLYLGGVSAVAQNYAYAFDAIGAAIHGDVYFDRFTESGIGGKPKIESIFTTDGVVRLNGAKIDGLLSMAGTRFTGNFKTGLDLNFAKIGGAFLWLNVERGTATELDLTGASIGALVDDTKSWPSKGHLFLDGCTYSRMGLRSPDDAISRENWLDRQPDDFRPQPYEVLAKVLADQGQEEQAVTIRIDEERARLPTLGWGTRFWRRMLGVFVAYGYRPLQAFWFIGFFVLVGWILFFLGYGSGLIVPSEHQAYQSFKYDQSQTPRGYQKFNSFVYALESFLPLVQLFQLSRWLPDPQTGSRFVGIHTGRLLRSYLWIHVLAGWFFTTMLVAGLSGIVHK